MTVVLHWTDTLPAYPADAAPLKRFAVYNTLGEAFEQAVAGDGLTASHISNEDGSEVFANSSRIGEYAKAKADLESARDAAIEKAHAKHADQLATLAG